MPHPDQSYRIPKKNIRISRGPSLFPFRSWLLHPQIDRNRTSLLHTRKHIDQRTVLTQHPSRRVGACLPSEITAARRPGGSHRWRAGAGLPSGLLRRGAGRAAAWGSRRGRGGRACRQGQLRRRGLGPVAASAWGRERPALPLLPSCAGATESAGLGSGL